MPFLSCNGVRLAYEIAGEGDPVLLVMGSAARGRVWSAHQVPALVAAGYRVVTFDNRGVEPSDVPPGPYRLDDLVDDTVALVEGLGLAPCRIAGVSMGAFVVQELVLKRPDLVRSAVLMATKARSDVARAAHSRAARDLVSAQVRLPASYRAATLAFQVLSPRTLNDDREARQWLDLFEQFPVDEQLSAVHSGLDEFPDRRTALQGVQCPCLVVAFEDDVMVPPHLGREVADAIPQARYHEIPGCGHLGYLEKPDEVNRVLLEFFSEI